MKKVLLVFALLGGTVFSTFAQTTTTSSSDVGKFSIGIEPGLPIGDASNVYSFVIGGSVKYDHPIATNTFVTISAGYNAFLVKSEFKDQGAPSSDGFIPLKAGIKYYASPGFFLEGQIGAAFYTGSGGGGTFFAYAPGIGYSFDGGFEAGLRYEGWSKDGTISQIGLRLAYRFQ